MEYLKDHGQFDDIPREVIVSELRTRYPQYFGPDSENAEGVEFLL